MANRIRNYFEVFSADCNFSFCACSLSGNKSVKVPFSKIYYFPNTMVPFGLEKMVEGDCSPGEQAENRHFQPFIVPLATFWKKDQKLPYM